MNAAGLARIYTECDQSSRKGCMTIVESNLRSAGRWSLRALALSVFLCAVVIRLDAAQTLIKRYEDETEWSVVFAWGCVLERLLSGDAAAADSIWKLSRR